MNNAQLQKVLTNMREMGLKQLLITSPMSIKYITGRLIGPGERLLALLVTDEGDCTLVANSLFAVGSMDGARLIEYDDTDDTAKLLSSLLQGGVLGVDKELKSRFLLPLMDLRSDIRPVLGSLCVDRARMIKTGEELSLMAESSRLNDLALSETIKTLRAGQSEEDVAGIYRHEALSLGSTGESFPSLICRGPNCAEPHHDTSKDLLQSGDSVILDVGLLHGGYCSDMTRTVFLGKPTDEMRKVYALVKAANEAGRAAVKPGVALKDVDRAARSVIESAGYGKYFIHRTGHNIGLEVHEYPDVSQSSCEVCQPGMVFSIEPGIYLPGRFGVRIEDLVAVTPEGGKTLNHLDRELAIL
ncbi:MAG: aminopeptidase P family protein [Clostridia bacterium]|nr:aminopeptidase P family protein [Clostridia bacterium]